MKKNENTDGEILAKSKKISQKKKYIIVWIVTAIIVITTIVTFFVDYNGYKDGQKFGLLSLMAVSESKFANDNTHAERCSTARYILDRQTSDLYINGYKIDNSSLREAERGVRSSFAKLMISAGYTRYNEYNIAKWFIYTNSTEYFTKYYWNKPIPVICYVTLVFAIIFTILVKRESKKELIVYEDFVLCKKNKRKSKQLTFNDINNIDFGKKSLKLVGTGAKYKISNLANVEELKTLIMEKKKTNTKNKKDEEKKEKVSDADELKKYKELLDSGVISQEEFDAKKKQILGI